MNEAAKTGAKKRSEQRHKGRVVPFRVSPEEYADLKQLAEREGLTLGSYIRVKAIGEPTKKKPTTRAVRRPVAEVEVLKGLLGQVGKIGGNLNQLAKGVNRGETPLVADIHETLTVIRQTAKRICDQMDGNT